MGDISPDATAPSDRINMQKMSLTFASPSVQEVGYLMFAIAVRIGLNGLAPVSLAAMA